MRKNYIAIAIAVSIVVAIVVAVLLFAELKDRNTNIEPAATWAGSLEDAKLISSLKGLIIMELEDKSGVKNGQLTYTLDVSDAHNPILSQAPSFVQPNDSHFSMGTGQITFTRLMPRKEGQVDSDIYSSMQVFVASLGIGNGRFPVPESPPYKITNNAGVLKQMPVLSPSGKSVLYMARSKIPESAVVGVKDWRIYLANVTPQPEVERGLASQNTAPEKVRSVASGTYPKWVNDDSFIYIADKGLMLHNLKGDSDTLLWGMADSGALSNMRLDVSDDKKFIAWSFPDIGKLWVLRATSWASPEVSLYDEILTHGFWPTFSPDSKYLAFQAVNWRELQFNPMPRIEVYALSENGAIKLDWEFSLEAFNQERMFITDWY